MIHCLNTLGFCWGQQSIRDQHLQDLKAFKQKHGHCNVPLRYPPNPVLGRWVNGIRQAKRRGTLEEDTVLRLDALGFSSLRKGRGDMVPWEQRFQELQRFKAVHGHCNVPHITSRTLHWVIGWPISGNGGNMRTFRGRGPEPRCPRLLLGEVQAAKRTKSDARALPKAIHRFPTQPPVGSLGSDRT